MQISLYIGTKRKKDRIVNNELSKYIEGDRSARIKDLILKGLIFEGQRDIDETLLDIRYMMDLDVEVRTSKVKKNDKVMEMNKIENNKNNLVDMETNTLIPSFDNISISKSDIDDIDLEDRI